MHMILSILYNSDVPVPYTLVNPSTYTIFSRSSFHPFEPFRFLLHIFYSKRDSQ